MSFESFDVFISIIGVTLVGIIGWMVNSLLQSRDSRIVLEHFLTEYETRHKNLEDRMIRFEDRLDRLESRLFHVDGDS
jgi:hypothetical protein